MTTFEPAGWAATTGRDGKETYTRHVGMVNVVAEWDPAASLGVIRVDDGIGTRYAAGSDAFGDAHSFWIAAKLVADTAAAPLPVAGHVIGGIKVDPGDFLEAELDLTLADGREIGLSVIDRQAFDLISDLHSVEKYVWAEQEDEDEEDDDPYEGPDHGAYREVLPRVTAAETLALVEILTSRFDLGRDAVNVSGGGSWITISGDDAVSAVLAREQEFDGAIGAKWRYATGHDGFGEQRLTVQYYPRGEYQT
ncbi:hypothetical protein [Saccharothrix sp. NRRL B-16314]|uniref:hypothetical protein n=1 Tax=Saccharothrix sp. NRRL B-16314 TaxID=1463825 RepID=UPI00068F1D17|nr:hypothetical protein [Saccharothrix sp. NRRL B-16314]